MATREFTQRPLPPKGYWRSRIGGIEAMLRVKGWSGGAEEGR
jgi:hypothetical protein